MKLKSTTPKSYNAAIRKFFKAAGFSKDPVYLPFSELNPSYQAKHCLDNCLHAEKERIGTPVYGWIIWEDRSRKFIEAEFHSVICKDGELLDITPRVDGEKRIMFASDSTRVPRFDGEGWNTFSSIKSMSGTIFEESREVKLGFDPNLTKKA